MYKETLRLTVYNALGEDAVNTAWLIFLRFIHRYKGRAFNHLPGLIKYHLHYGLLRQVRKEGRSWDNEVASEELMKMHTHEQLEQPLETIAIKHSAKKTIQNFENVLRSRKKQQANCSTTFL